MDARTRFPGSPAVSVTPLRELQDVPVRWVWPGYFASARLALIEGEPGVGKSFVALDLAARLSSAAPMPDGYQPWARTVLYVTGEDFGCDTIKPRATAAGADPDRFVVVGMRAGRTLPPIAPDGTHWIRDLVLKHKIDVLVIDPLHAFMEPGGFSSSASAARAALLPFLRITDTRLCSVLAVRHTTKGRGPWSTARGVGHISLLGSARTGLYVSRHPDDPELRVLSVSKQNASRPGPSLGFRLVDGKMAWEGPLDVTAEELTGVPPREAWRRPRDRAAAWLRLQLADGPRPASELTDAAIRAGIPERTLHRAKAAAKIRAVQRGRDGKNVWVWYDPEVTPEVPDPWPGLGPECQSRARKVGNLAIRPPG
jgi:hypothetical protein